MLGNEDLDDSCKYIFPITADCWLSPIISFPTYCSKQDKNGLAEWAACNPVSSVLGSIFVEEGPHRIRISCQASHLIYSSRNEALALSSYIPQI